MRDFTLSDLFVRNERINKEKTALVAGEQRITFGRLSELCGRLAAQLAARGIGMGDRVAMLAMNHPGFFVLFGAVARLGAILVPMNWRLSQEELGFIMKDSGAKILFADENYLAVAKQIGEPLLVPVLQLSADTETVQDTGNRCGAVDITADTPCCLIYTAAVEGSPRGAVLSHGNLLSANLQVIVSMGLSESDVNLAMLPLFHITGMNLALAVMQVGGINVVVDKFTEKTTAQLTEKEGVTLWGSFPPILQRMVAHMESEPFNHSSLKYVVGIDGPDTIASFERIAKARFWILYGQSETSGFVTFSPASDKLGSAGRPGPLSLYTLVDEEDNEVAAGETGEIVVRGPLVFQGYWGLEEVNRKTFRHGWHHTGDLGQTDADGFLFYKGRKPEKELIKPGGENVYPAEVEAVILRHPAVQAVSVIGVADPKFGEGVKAVCVLKAGQSLDAEALRKFVGSRIAGYKKPGYVQFVDELPMKNDTIDRLRVKELYGD